MAGGGVSLQGISAKTHDNLMITSESIELCRIAMEDE